MSREVPPPPPVHSARAQWAWTRVHGVYEQTGGRSLGKDYATQVRKLPARLLVNGLGQTAAFLFAKQREKGETGAGLLLDHVGARIASVLPKGLFDQTRREELMRVLVNMTPDQYRRCTHELLVTAEWLKRFVDGLFEKEDT